MSKKKFRNSNTKNELNIVFQKISQIYPILALEVLDSDIGLESKSWLDYNKALYRTLFTDNNRKALQILLIQTLPISIRDILEVKVYYQNSLKYKDTTQNSKEFCKFLRHSLCFVEFISRIPDEEWEKAKKIRQEFFEKNIIPIVQIYQKNPWKYFVWKVKYFFHINM